MYMINCFQSNVHLLTRSLMSDFPLDDGPKKYEEIYALIQYTNYPAYQTEQLHILKPHERNNQGLEREVDSDGIFTTTIGSEKFYQFAKVLHPDVTDPILCAEHVLYEDMVKLKSLINPRVISNGQIRWLHNDVADKIKEIRGAIDLEILSEIRRHTFQAARMMQFAIHYSQIRDLITTKEIFSAYGDSFIHQAWENLRDNEKNIQNLRSLIDQIEEENSYRIQHLSMLDRM